MRIKIEQFLRNFGIRTAGEVLRPRLHHQSKLVLPHQSVYHFLDSNTTVLGPNQNDPLISRLQGKVFIEHKTFLDVIEGNPIRTSVVANSLVTEFRRNNRFFKLLRKDESVILNTQNVPLFNYNMLNRLYRYQVNMKSNYFRWRNINNTFWNGVINSVERFNWNNFIEIEIPKQMPTYAEFRRAEKDLTKAVLEIFNNDAKLNLMEIIKFVGPNQKDSTLFKLLKPKTDKDGNTTVSTDTIDKINFIVRTRNSFFIINLGKLFEYRDNEELSVSTEEFNLIRDSIDLNDQDSVNLVNSISQESLETNLGLEAFKPNVLQLRLVSLFTTLSEYDKGLDIEEKSEVIVGPDIEEDVIETDTLDNDEDLDSEIPLDHEDPEDVEITDTNKTKTNNESVLRETIGLDTIEVTHIPSPTSELETVVLEVERDPIEVAKDSTTLNVDVNNSKALEEEVSDDPHVKAVAKAAKELVDVGAISPFTYEKVIEQAKGYLKMEDPFGTGLTVAEAMVIKPESLKLEKPALKKSDVVSDESLAHDVHTEMRKKYIKEVLPKDILKSIMAVQKTGTLVLGIKSEIVEDALDHYQEFHVQLKPIRGKITTVTIRIPVVNEEGRFKTNGVTYTQRMQVGDIPIRKVSSTKVALTSYYSKVFVNRSDLSVNNFDNWLHRNITRLSIDEDVELNDLRVKNLRISPKSYAKYKLPRIYTRLSNRLDGFDTLDYKFNLNYEGRESILKGSDTLKSIEGKDYVLCGTKGTSYLLAGFDESFYSTKDGVNYEPLPSITDILNLNPNKAPVDVATISVGGKDIPLGFVLAYRSGFTKLLESLNVNYVTHQRGTRIKLEPDEYTLTFMDEVLVFNRSDYKANLIIAGFRMFNKVIKGISRWDLDRKDAYYRLAESRGLGTRHIVGIDDLYSSWMDPITEELLADMGEPTDFEKLLYRAVELLTTDWSPDEVDGAYLRYKGYERTAGMIYSTLMRAANKYNAQQGRGAQSILIHPFEVWTKITTDPTVSVVEDINPMQTIREQEVVTFSGEGGRSAQTLVARTRVFHENDLGIVSEATVDSGNSGAVFYLAPDANFTNVRGVTKPFDSKTDGAAKILSTASLASIGVENDDCKTVLSYKREFPLIAGTSLELIILQSNLKG